MRLDHWIFLFQAEVKMGEYKAAKKSLEAALNSLSSMSNISCKEKESNAAILKQAIAKFSKREDTKEEKEEQGAKVDPRLVLEEGEEEEGVASCLSVRSTEGAGRHTVANRQIPAGTLLATGEPAVALLNPDNKNLVTQFCLNCLHSTATPAATRQACAGQRLPTVVKLRRVATGPRGAGPPPRLARGARGHAPPNGGRQAAARQSL